MLRIAVVTAHFPSSLAPTDGRMAIEVVRLLSRQNTVRVFFPLSAYPPLLSPRYRKKAKVDPSFAVSGIDVGYHVYHAVPFFSRPLNGLFASRALLSDVRNFRPDLIYSIILYPSGYSALRIANALNVPAVVEGVGSDIHSIGDPITALYTRKVLRRSDYLFTVSESLRQLAIGMGARAEASRAVLNGCDPSVFRARDKGEARQRLGLDLDAGIVVYVGRIDIKKGLRELVQAAALAHAERRTLRVYMVGNGPDKPVIQNAIHLLDAGKYVHIMPGCSFHEVADWMTAADLVTLPSYAEGCPNTVVESLACGRPVVATNVGGIPEILDAESGCLVPARDPQALAAALSSVLARGWDAAAISKKHGRTWEAAAAERLEIFESLVTERRRLSKFAMV